MTAPGKASVSPAVLSELSLPFGADFSAHLVDNLYDGVYFVDTERRILYWNRGAERLTGLDRQEVVGRPCQNNILDHVDADGNNLCSGACPLLNAVTCGEPTCARVFLRHRDGRRIPVDVNIMPVRGRDGQIVGGVEIFRDASCAVALEGAYGRMRELAEKDPLTGICNRRALESMLEQQAELLRRAGSPFSVFLVDLDHFKSINDGWSHKMGDRVLAVVAGVIARQLRRSDLVGRYGGEEFVAVLTETPLEVASGIAERVRNAIPRATPCELTGRTITASLGVAQAVVGESAASVVHRADEAMYQAKRSGRNRVEVSISPTPPACDPGR